MPPCNGNNINGSPLNGMNTSVAMSTPSSLSMNLNQSINQSIRVHSPATATPAIRAPKEVAYRPKGTIRLFGFFSFSLN